MVGDVRTPQSLDRIKDAETIILLAAVHRDDVPDVDDYFTTNVQGAKNVVEACERFSINKIIFSSSVAVYSTSCKANFRGLRNQTCFDVWTIEIGSGRHFTKVV